MTQPQQPAVQDRIMAAFRALVRGELPQLTFHGIYEYSVQATDGTTVDCDATDTTIPLPGHLAKVPLRSSILGGQVSPTQGCRCLIAFVNGDPARPICVFVDPTPATALVAATGTLSLKGGGMPPTEHVMTTEAVVMLVVNLLYVMAFTIGNPSTWIGTGKIFDPTDSSMTLLGTTIANLLTTCNAAVFPTPTLGGGIMTPAILAAVKAQLAAKIPDAIPGVTPVGIGAPSVQTG